MTTPDGGYNPPYGQQPPPSSGPPNYGGGGGYEPPSPGGGQQPPPGGGGYGPPPSGYGPPPGGGYPGYPQGSYGPPPGRNNKTRFIVGGIVAAVVVIGLVIGAIVIFTGGEKSAGSPKEAVELFMKAAKSDDVDQAKKVTCQKYRGQIKDSGLGGGNQIDSYTIGKEEKISSTHYRYTVTVKSNGSSGPIPMDVTKEDGNWVICPDYAGSDTGISTDEPGGSRPTFDTGNIDIPSDFPTDFPTDFNTDDLNLPAEGP